ncbi:MAG TPA: efflux RND transporter periplasmic adaptor subunit [Phycisphaerae bacterium]|nr:efflux RND transporter periplasmic adaptor subunit [Phycisphaerae bacterium]HPS52095.1 efflux RND transporter periplasmic adaptor subunit [Phycisphaerae bacterium]
MITFALLPAAAQEVSTTVEPTKVEAFTKPNFDAILSFAVPGTIAEISVEIGQKVKKGQVLARLEDSVEQTRQAQLQAQAENTIKIKAAAAQLDQKKVDLERTKAAAKDGAATELEMEYARLDVLTQELTKQIEEFNNSQDKLKNKEMKSQVDRMKIVSPCDGIIETRFVEKGQAVDSNTQAIRVVNIDPLWVDVPLSVNSTMSLKIGGKMKVRYLNAPAEVCQAEILNVASTVDPASDTRLVRLEIPNPSKRPAGERVEVLLDENQTQTRTTAKTQPDKNNSK